MKNYLLCAVLLFLAISCSTESDYEHSQNVDSKEIALRTSSQIPKNKTNPFDARGKEYLDLLTIYLKNNKVPNSINELTDRTQFLLKNYGEARFLSKINATFTAKQAALLMGFEKPLTDLIESCNVTPEVKHYLINFFQALLAQEGQEYDKLYNYIVSFETGILRSNTLKDDEKETILTVSSISTYALYIDPKHKDRDWEISVANRKVQPVFNSHRASIISVLAVVRTLF